MGKGWKKELFSEAGKFRREVEAQTKPNE